MMEKLCKYADFDMLHGVLGICFSGEMANSGFPYGIGVEYNGKALSDDFDIVEIPAHTYAVFQCRGKMPDAFVDTYKKICTEFFPQSTTYEYGNGIELEVIPPPMCKIPITAAKSGLRLQKRNKNSLYTEQFEKKSAFLQAPTSLRF